MSDIIKKRLCIVSPDLIGPVRNGGIGTHCWHLLQILKTSNNYDISVFFTGPYETETRDQSSQRYAALGVAYFDLHDLPSVSYKQYGGEWFVDNSLRLRDFLASKNFDTIHFQDWQANGFAAIQAKRTGLQFLNTTLTLTLHSSSKWIRQGMQQWPENPVTDALLDFCERYCAENADITISPSQYMFDWASSNSWKLANRCQLAPYPYVANTITTSANTDFSHIIFFGRLETRKGLEIFCQAIQQICSSEPHNDPINKVTFLGKFGGCSNGKSAEVVKQTISKLQQLNVSTEIKDNLNSIEAQNFLATTRGVVVIPSLLDNFPFTVLECINLRLDLLASKIGGLPEMLPANCLFEPNATALREALAARKTRLANCNAAYNIEAANQTWLELSSKTILIDKTISTPLVSICIPYFNLPHYLPQLLQSLKLSNYSNYEVIVVNDGSSDALANKIFEEQRQIYSNWKFLNTNNSGIGQARNTAASSASGEYLIFMDADNLATPSMISTFVKAMQHSDADCLSCHFFAFEGLEVPGPDFVPLYSHLPVGACWQTALIGNVLGDANFCIKRSVFKELNGFSTDRSCSYEDWEFLVRLVLQNKKLDVVPEKLFLYRHCAEGFSRQTKEYHNQMRVIKAYAKHSSWDHLELLSNLTVPLAKQVQKYSIHAEELSKALDHYRTQVLEYERVLKDTQRELAKFNRPIIRFIRKILTWC